MIPPPPRSTLFPYTTLFRSGVGLAQLDGVVRRQLAEGDVAGQRAARRHPLDQLILQADQAVVRRLLRRGAALRRRAEAVGDLPDPRLALLRLHLGDDLLQQVGALQ